MPRKSRSTVAPPPPAAEEEAPRSAVLSRALLLARTSRKCTQEALAALCAVGQSTIAKRELGGRPLNEASLENSAAGLGLSARQVLLEYLEPERAAAMTFDRDEVNALGRAVKGVRLSRGESQADFAVAVAVTATWVSRMESGRSHLSDRTIEQLAHRLGMDLESFLRVGLVFEPRPDPIDLDALRTRTRALVDAGVPASRIAEALDLHRGRISRFLGGEGLAEEALKKLGKILTKTEHEMKGRT